MLWRGKGHKSPGSGGLSEEVGLSSALKRVVGDDTWDDEDAWCTFFSEI